MVLSMEINWHTVCCVEECLFVVVGWWRTCRVGYFVRVCISAAIFIPFLLSDRPSQCMLRNLFPISTTISYGYGYVLPNNYSTTNMFSDLFSSSKGSQLHLWKKKRFCCFPIGRCCWPPKSQWFCAIANIPLWHSIHFFCFCQFHHPSSSNNNRMTISIVGLLLLIIQLKRFDVPPFFRFSVVELKDRISFFTNFRPFACTRHCIWRLSFRSFGWRHLDFFPFPSSVVWVK